MAEKRKLGRGLDSIFGGNVEEVLDQIEENAKEMPGRKEIQIPVDEIRPNPYQPRKEFDQKGASENEQKIIPFSAKAARKVVVTETESNTASTATPARAARS